MSRYRDYDDYEGEPEQILAMGRWEHNSRTALKGRRGRQALRDLREALLALPEHRLIGGALCTVGADRRAAQLPDGQWDYERRDFTSLVEHQGEGVCGIGAYLWHQKVKGGMDPAEAFDSLPAHFGSYDDGEDWLERTARLGRDAGLTLTLAWNLAYRNDETLGSCTPEERWQRFMDWIDTELAEAAPAEAGSVV